MRHLLSLFDISQQELQTILSISEQVKGVLLSGRRPAWLARRVLALLFEKPSLRTRVSFEAGISQLGGTAMFLGSEVGWQKREKTSDFIQVLSQYTDYVVCRAKSHESLLELASFNCVPIINGLTDKSHPCQALADLLTVRQATGSMVGRQVTFVGDGNNVAYSMALACAMVGMRFRLLGPQSHFMDSQILSEISDRYPNADIEQTEDIATGMHGADFAYTDVWTSMGQEAEAEARQQAFAPYQVNGKLMSHAPAGCKLLHCLPARRGEEVTDEVIDGPDSLIVDQAGNRMHAQKGLLIWLALQHGHLSASELEQEGIELPIGTS
ncbi:ornithine carbamoyltransferase [Aureliella helgolandensis]|uniref:Ornithine carbamoyltransferase n=1 Tax=Aureliella helgolandensis TaxID=2527968 RepID=A0A518G772_9BACT|nr:ornithine carbamoyltransferase [Aureliella helgolandensis]QDV24435.1 Ornithine carbamoyltransferase [Aureliella helgolandensis]